MAREIKDIKEEMTNQFLQNETIQSIYGVNDSSTFDEQFSKVSIESILFTIIATSIWTLEKLFDLHKKEVTDYIAQMKPHSLRWYANKAKAFQLGDDLAEDEDFYDNTGKTEEEIAGSRIIAHSAVVEQDRYLRVKVAKIVGDDLGPLSNGTPTPEDDELAAFSEYMQKIKDAGVKLIIDSNPADLMLLQLDIYYNPLILNSAGQRLDGKGDTPVQDAVKSYLRNLPFNGVLIKAHLVDVLQEVVGVIVPVVKSMQVKYGSQPYVEAQEFHTPDAGYIRLDPGVEFEPNFKTD